MDNKEQAHLILRITEYGLKHQKFAYKDMAEAIGLTGKDENYVYGLLSDKFYTENPNHLMVTIEQSQSYNWRDYKYSIVPTAFYNYVDYLEIVESRKAAEQARLQSERAHRLAMIAIGISIALGIAQIIVSMM